jgi:excisionase family DNA binding protein
MKRHVPAPRILTVKEVANYLQVSRATVLRLLKRDQLPAFKIGSDWRFNVEQIDRWRAEQEIRYRDADQAFS